MNKEQDCSQQKKKPKSANQGAKAKGKAKADGPSTGPMQRAQAETEAKAEANAKEEGQGEAPATHPRDGARGQEPPLDPGQTTQVAHNLQIRPAAGTLQKALQDNLTNSSPCQWQGVRNQITNWQQLTKDKMVLKAIAQGVRAPLARIPAPNCQQLRDCTPQEDITKTFGEYLQTKAIRPRTKEEEQKPNIGCQYLEDQ